jgi:prepilin-type N-terminal cleavage/methylation domain-containing protein
MKSGKRNRAFSLVEVMLVVIISAIILSAAWAVLAATMSGDQALRTRVDLQLEASNALKEVTSLLKQSGSTAAPDPVYPVVFQLGQSLSAPGAALSGIYSYANSCVYGLSQTDNTCVQAPNVVLEEGLGPSQGILFRIAKDQDHLDAQRTIPVTKTGKFAIEWGNECHALTIAVNSATGVSELQHQVWDATTGLPKARTVLAHYVSRLLFETTTSAPPAPTPLWPLPTGAVYAPLPWPAQPTNPYEIRVTLCLAKPDLSNPTNSLHSSKRMTAVWQQSNVIMRSVPR